MKSAVLKLRLGPKARVEVKLHNKTKVKGYISESNDEGFFIVDEKTGATTHLTYSQVKQVKTKSHLNGKKIALAFAIIAYVTVIAILQINCNKNC